MIEIVVTKGENTSPEPETLDLGPLLTEIGARLITVGKQSLPEAQSVRAAQNDDIQILVFSLAQKQYALLIHHVREVVREPAITRVPGLPEWVQGVTNAHGEIMSVVDLAAFLGIATETIGQRRSMLIAQAGDQQIGLMVDRVDLIYRILAEQIISPPFTVDANFSRSQIREFHTYVFAPSPAPERQKQRFVLITKGCRLLDRGA